MLPVLLALSTSPARAGDGPPPPTVDGLVVMQYAFELTEGRNNANAFDINRAYFGVREDFNDHVAARILLDTGRGADNTKEWMYLKNAFVEWKEPFAGGKVQGGLIPTPYVGFTEQFWKHRYVAKAYTEQYGLLSSADFGLSVQGTHGKGLVDWHAAVVNGEGYGAPEVDATKALQARFTLDPLAPKEKMNLAVTGFVSYTTASPDTDPATDGNQEGDPTLLYAAGLGYKMDYLLVWGEYVARNTGKLDTGGYSATMMPRMPKVGSLYVRYDHFDPDADTDKDATDRILVGASHDFLKKVSLAVQYDRATADSSPDTPTHGVYLKAQAGF